MRVLIQRAFRARFKILVPPVHAHRGHAQHHGRQSQSQQRTFAALCERIRVALQHGVVGKVTYAILAVRRTKLEPAQIYYLLKNQITIFDSLVILKVDLSASNRFGQAMEWV